MELPCVIALPDSNVYIKIYRVKTICRLNSGQNEINAAPTNYLVSSKTCSIANCRIVGRLYGNFN